MKKTNFDDYVEEQLKDPKFAERFEEAGEAWDIALQIASLRQAAGISQKQLAEMLGTSQQQVSRLESPSYQGHSVSTLRKVAQALNAKVRIVFEQSDPASLQVAEPQTPYLPKAAKGKRSGRPVKGDA